MIAPKLPMPIARQSFPSPDPDPAGDASGAPRRCELTILMPCLNEAETLETCLADARSFLERTGIAGEIVVADNGSTDGSQRIAAQAGARVVHVDRRGYGAALMGGIGVARGTFVIMGDADASYDFSRLDAFVEALRAGNRLVMGNRFRGGIAPGAMPTLHRFLGNPVLSYLGRLFFRAKIGDFHCGLRGFHTRAIRDLGLQTTGMEFASEMVVRAVLTKLPVAEVPTVLRRDGRSRPPHLNTWRDGWRHLKFLLMFSPKWLFVLPGAALAAAGLLLAARLLSGPVPILANVVLDLNTLICSCFLIVSGFQVLTFGVLTRYYATARKLIPGRSRLDPIVRWFNTERMLMLAAGLLAGGIGGFAFALHRWAQVDFGPLNEPFIPRLVVVSLTFVTVAI